MQAHFIEALQFCGSRQVATLWGDWSPTIRRSCAGVALLENLLGCRTIPKKLFTAAISLFASMATAGTSAALTVNAGAVNAQTATSSANPASGTTYTGDVIRGKKVVTALNVNDLESGQKHLLYFRAWQMPTGQHWHVSVTVARGARPGKRVILVSGVHGDEMSSIHAVQTVMNQLNPAAMSGTVMAVTDVSRPAFESMQRRWPNSGRGSI